MTAILGISAFYHDSAAALIIDGEIVAAAQEERFTRKKHDPSYPLNAIEYCANASGWPGDPISNGQTSINPSSNSAICPATDTDGDGVIDDDDQFPSEPDEWLDTDSDGIGNNEDTDDDGENEKED